MVTKKMPMGCDQQGRYPEAAEAATEVGADEPPEHNIIKDIAKEVAISLGAVAVLGVVVLFALGQIRP